MPSRVIRRSTRRTVRSRRRHQWVDAADDIPNLAVGSFDAIDLLANYRAMPGAEGANVTVIRTHLRFWVTSAVVAGDGIAVGLAVDDIGEAVGNAALGSAHAWNPIDQPYLPWMLYQRFNAHPQYDFHGGTSANLEFDVRSKRKVAFGDTLFLSAVNIDASLPISYAYHARVLLALS